MLAVVLAILGLIPPFSALSAPLGEVRLALVKQPPPPPEKQGPRVALFLIDCSCSMHSGIQSADAGPGNPRRWDEVRKGLRLVLEQLQQASPGIEVRLRFFATSLDCLPPARVRLNVPSDVDALMHDVPLAPPEKGVTALWDSVVTCIRELRRENKASPLDYWLFGVFGDGENSPSGGTMVSDRERDAQLADMQKEGAKPPLVLIVGPEAAAAAKRGMFGPMVVVDIGKLLPEPPKKPKDRYALALADGQPLGMYLDVPAKAGRHSLSVVVNGPPDSLRLKPTVSGNPPCTISPSTLKVTSGSPASLELDFGKSVDAAANASVRLDFTAEPTQTDSLDIDGATSVTFTFKADGTLPPEKWTLVHDPAVKRGGRTSFTAIPGSATSQQWVFRGPNGVTEVENVPANQPVVSHTFSVPGMWQCEFTCVSEAGDKRSRKAEPIECVDADFTMDPPKASVGLGEEIGFTIKPTSEATANYACFLDGKPLVTPSDGTRVVVPKGMLDQSGRHVLAVVARSKLGGFEWRHEVPIKALAKPQIGVIPTDFVEGRVDIPFTIKVAGDVGESVDVFANGKHIDKYPVVYADEKSKDSFPARIPAADISTPQVSVEVRPAKEGSCQPGAAILKGRAASIHAALKKPLPGTQVSEKGGTALVLEPEGDHAGDVGDVQFDVAFAAPGTTPESGSSLAASKTSKWTIAMPPFSRLGLVDVYAKPQGGRLQPKVFPEGKDWEKIGSYRVVAAPRPVAYALSVAGLLGALGLLWAFLSGNEGRTWRLETSFTDPKSPTNDMDGGFIPVGKRKKRPSSLTADGGFVPYQGWNWWPRFLGGKHAAIPMWVIADRNADDPRAAWLTEATLKSPNHVIKIIGESPDDPFLQLPTSDWGWIDPTSPYDPVHAGRESFSRTWKLTMPTTSARPGGSLWLRMRQRPLGHPNELWIFWGTAACALALAIYLLKHFHIFSSL
jgi:hypothetical protein